MKIIIVLVVILALGYSLNNGLGAVPPLGWNSWNKFACNVNEDLIKQQADALASSGLKDAGYQYINIDDCWQTDRDKDGYIIEDPVNFKSGMKSLADYVHSKGLKFGVYSDAGSKTCAGRPGSLGYEEKDAKKYAEWGVDYLKYDNCYDDGTSPKVRYPPMRDALNKTGRPIFFSMCEWGVEDPAYWAREVGNSWRTTGDISDNWNSFSDLLDKNEILYRQAGPYGFNDPDMLEVGNGGMTFDEYKSHFSLWALMKSPLLIGCDMRTMSDETKLILSNKDIIAMNQDRLGIQGHRIWSNTYTDHDLGHAQPGEREIYAVDLEGGKKAVILFNRKMSDAAAIKFEFKYADWTDGTIASVYDMWEHKELGEFEGSFTATVPKHGVVVIRLTPK